MDHAEPTEDEVLGWVSELSNWGRWGPDDHLGTLNLIDDDVRRRAAAAVRLGSAISCAWEIPAGPRLDGSANRFMIASGEGLAAPDPRHHAHAATDALQLQVHGLATTHLDALSHWFWDARMYNDRPATSVTAERGATELGVETIPDGVVTRGVLLDVAAARGVDALNDGEAVLPADLVAAEENQGVCVERGDAVLLSTGLSRRRREQGINAPMRSWPGWHAACLPWLHARDVALIASEASNEVMPNPYTALARHPVHSIGIAAMGLWLIDNCDLERLASACAAAGQWTFLFTAAPLRVQGATGSPLNPIALL